MYIRLTGGDGGSKATNHTIMLEEKENKFDILLISGATSFVLRNDCNRVS